MNRVEWGSRALAMYVLAVGKRYGVVFDLKKINDLFETNYKTLAKARDNLFLNVRDFGIDVESRMMGNLIYEYKMKPNRKTMEALEADFLEKCKNTF